MAEGVLGLGAGQAASLNQDLIDKLKAAERKATVKPIEDNLENMKLEKEVFSEIEKKVSELLTAIKPLDLFVTNGVNVFDEKSATTTGDSVTFDAVDASILNKGITSVDIKSLAQKDVYQTNSVNTVTKDSLINAGTLDIMVNGTTHSFDTTSLTYEQLATEINKKTGIIASMQEVGTDSFRLVIKSEESGIENALSIGGSAANSLGLDLSENHTLNAQDMNAFVDGIEYNVASNNLTVDGLKITAAKVGESSINVIKDTSKVGVQIKNFIDSYNQLVKTIDDATQADSPISNKAELRNIISQIKDKLFGMYGENSDKSVFNFGLEFNKTGMLSIDETKFNNAIKEDLDGLKELFIGTAAKEGIGTQLKAAIDEMKFSSGVLSVYENSMDIRKESLEEDKKKAEEALKDKYKQLALQFGAYGTIINQMESSFSGLKLMIQQSTAS